MMIHKRFWFQEMNQIVNSFKWEGVVVQTWHIIVGSSRTVFVLKRKSKASGFIFPYPKSLVCRWTSILKTPGIGWLIYVKYIKAGGSGLRKPSSLLTLNWFLWNCTREAVKYKLSQADLQHSLGMDHHVPWSLNVLRDAESEGQAEITGIESKRLNQFSVQMFQCYVTWNTERRLTHTLSFRNSSDTW